MQKHWIINGLLVIGSVTAFFFIIEFGLRITGLQTVTPNPPKIYQNSENPDIGYELKPNLKREKAYRALVSTDEVGFRSNGRLKMEDGKLKIVVLGDSIAFGYGVDDNETLSAQLEKHLNLQSSIFNLQFTNAAVPGYQLQQQTAVYIDKIRPLDPDGVILVFFWNDLHGFLPGFLDEQGILRPHGWKPQEKLCQPIETGILGMLPAKCWLDEHSAFYKAFKKLVNLKESKQRQTAEREQPTEMPEEKFTQQQLEVYARDLLVLTNHLPKNRTFIIWPDNRHHTEMRKKLITIAKQYGFTVIDLYELFGNAVETLPWDTVHPSSEAIKQAAEFIGEQLQSKMEN